MLKLVYIAFLDYDKSEDVKLNGRELITLTGTSGILTATDALSQPIRFSLSIGTSERTIHFMLLFVMEVLLNFANKMIM